LVPKQQTSRHEHLNDYGTICKLKLRTQGRVYSTMFVMSPGYFGTSVILSRNLVQVNVLKFCICGFIYIWIQTTYISKYDVYIQIKVKTKMWNLCLKTLHVVF